MIQRIIHLSIKHKLIVGLLVLSIIGWGTYSLSKLPIDALPDITSNQVQVITQSPALASSEVEKFITYPLEISLKTIPNVKQIRSISRMGLSIITVVFEDEVAIPVARQQVAEKLKAAEPYLVQGAGVPEMAPITTGLGEFFQYTLDVDPAYQHQYSLSDLRTYQDWIVKRQLLGIKGVVEISSFGGHLKQYEVAVNPARLKAMGLDLNQLLQTLQNNNANSGGSYLERESQAYFIRAEGMIKSLADIENMVVSQSGPAGLPIKIKDVAQVRYGKAVRYGAMVKNGKGEAVGGVMLLLKGADANRVVQEVKLQMEQIQRSLPKGIRIVPYLDRSVLIGKAISTVQKNLIEGGLIVIFILILLLGNWRAGLIVASVIPLCLLFAFGMMDLFGVSANLMSLGAIDFGLIVDGAVIIVESIIHRLHVKHKGLSLSQDSMDQEVAFSAREIFNSAAFGVLIILIVYFPIMALGGIEGKMFRPMAQTVSFAIIGALILSLTYVPMASALFLNKNISHTSNWADRLMGRLYRAYLPLIEFALNKPKGLLLAAMLLFGLSIWQFGRLGGEFIPELNEGDFAVETILPTNASLSQSIDVNNRAQQLLLKTYPDEIQQVVSRIGASEIPTDPMGINSCDLLIILKEPEHWTKAEDMEELEAKMDETLNVFPEVNFEFTQPIQMRFNELIAGVKSDIAVKIFGDDLESLFQLATEASRYIRDVEGVGDIKVQQVDGVPQLVIRANRQKLSQYGLNVQELNQSIKTAFAGESAGFVMEGERRFDLVLRLDSTARNSIDELKNLAISRPNGPPIPLSALAEVGFEDAPVEVSRDDARRRITIGINVRNRDVESVVADIQSIMKQKISLPTGYYVKYGGTFENLQAAKDRLLLVVPLALALIFLLLFFTFQSLKEAAIIYLAIPLSAIGGIWSLWLRDMPFSVSAGIGFIALFGVAVLNGIVLLAHFKQLKAEGWTGKDLIIQGISTRFRPILMTASVASLGFLPMALSQSPGAEVQRPLATVVIGGLITATLLTLLVLPVVYALFMQGERNKVSLKSLVLLLGLGLLLPAQAQAQKPSYDLNTCMELGLKNHKLIQSVEKELNAANLMVGSGKELPKANIDVQFGRTQVFGQNDYTFLGSQSIPWPGFLKAQVQALKQQSRLVEQQLRLAKVLVQSSVKWYYHQILVQQKQGQYLALQDSLYQSMRRAAQVKFKEGETNKLEMVAAETRWMAFQQKRKNLDLEIKNLYQQLGYWIQVPGSFQIKDMALGQDQVAKWELNLSQNPQLAYYAEQLNLAKLNIELEKQKLKPDIRIGLTNQSIERVSNQNFAQVGLSIPLFAKAQKARIAASEQTAEAMELQYLQNKERLETDLQALVLQHQKSQNALNYYHQTALNQAQWLENTALKSYQQGDIEYVEILQNLQTAWQIREDYLVEMLAFHQNIIQIETLLAHEK